MPPHAYFFERPRFATVLRGYASSPAKGRRIRDETKLSGVQHRPSLSGPSLGILLTELSATNADNAGMRKEGHTMSEEHRTTARRMAQLLLGVPVAFGTVVVGCNWVCRWLETGDEG